MQINMFSMNLNQKDREGIRDVRNLVGDSLQEIRSLSKTLNHEVIANIGFEKSIKTELARFEKNKFLMTEMTVEGEEVYIDPKDEIILYRIVQEFFSNTIKHAEATSLRVKLEYTSDSLAITIQDDGVGYDMGSVQANSGLINMKSRAALIKANLDCTSESNKGVMLILRYPFKKEDLVNETENS